MSESSKQTHAGGPRLQSIAQLLRFHLNRAVVVAVIAMRMVEMAIDEVVHVIAVRNLRMTAIRAVDMPFFVVAFQMGAGAAVRISRRNGDDALVDVIAVHVV